MIGSRLGWVVGVKSNFRARRSRACCHVVRWAYDGSDDFAIDHGDGLWNSLWDMGRQMEKAIAGRATFLQVLCSSTQSSKPFHAGDALRTDSGPRFALREEP